MAGFTNLRCWKNSSFYWIDSLAILRVKALSRMNYNSRGAAFPFLLIPYHY